MADTFTGQGSLDFSKAAYDRMAYFAYRPELYFDQAADVKPTAQSMPGASVQFTIVNDLAINTTPLSETTDVSAVALSDSTVALTLKEYGNAVVTTALLRGTSFLDVDPVAANVVGYNAGASLDTLARAALDSGTNVMYGSGLGATTVGAQAASSRGAVGSQNTLSSIDIRVARARLRSQNVPTFGGMYVGYIHPDLVADLQGETVTGSNLLGWRAPHVYAQPNEIWNGELGAFEGVRWIETPRAPVFEGAGTASAQSAFAGTITIPSGGYSSSVTVFNGTFTGAAPTVGATLTAGTATLGSGTNTVVAVSGNTFTFSNSSNNAPTVAGTVTASASLTGTNVYGTLILGRQALAKAHSYVDGNGAFPTIVPGPITDHLRRLVPLGWYWLGAYGIFRQAAIMRIESSSTIGADLDTAYNPGIDMGESGSPLA
jgi:N4-gp56 family major capsid protein